MKKLIAVALVIVMLASLAACGTVNKTEVAILWKEQPGTMVPNSLINAVERAMYIENISYNHYYSNKDAAKQLELAKKSVEAGCSALMVELVNAEDAQSYVDLAKGKNIPIVFFGCEVDEAVVAGYNKCVNVSTDQESVAQSLSEKIIEGIVAEKGLFKKTEILNKEVDRNEDGRISYMLVGDGAAIAEAVDAKLAEKKLTKLELVATAADAEAAKELLKKAEDTKFTNSDKDEVGLLKVDGKAVELIITTDDELGLTVLTELQSIGGKGEKKGYNFDRLKTHFVSLYTVGSHQDAKYMLNKGDYEEEEWNALIYTTMEVVEKGLISGNAMEDYDTIATVSAKCLKNLLKGKTATKNVEEKLITKAGIIDIPYTIS